MTAHGLEELFLHLPRQALFEGACYVEPARHTFDCRHAYMIGQCGYVQAEPYVATCRSFKFEENRRAAARGWLQEQADCSSAVASLKGLL